MEIAIVYMVAGVSSRFGGKIKALVKINGEETLIEYSLNQALPAGFTKIIFIVGEKTEQAFREKFGNNYKGIPIEYALQTYDENQRTKPWGSADALCSAKKILNCPFVVCNGDDLYGENTFKILTEHLEKENEEIGATAGYILQNVLSGNDFANRGIFHVDEDKYMIDIKEELGISFSNLSERNINETDLCSMNVFAFFPNTLSELNKKVEEFKEKNPESKNAECFLPTEINNLIKEGKLKVKVYPTNENWYGITYPEDELKIKEQLKNKKFS